MTATLERPQTDAAHWSQRPLSKLPGARLPAATVEHLKRQGIDTIGKLSDAINDARDVGLGDRAETVRAAVEDLIRDESIESPDVFSDDESEDEAAADAAAMRAEAIPDKQADMDQDDADGDDPAADANDDEPKAEAEVKEPGGSEAKPVDPGRPNDKASDAEDDRLDEIYRAHKRVMDSSVRMARAKAAYKTAKDEHDEALIELQAVILDSRQPTLFDTPKTPASAKTEKTTKHGTSVATGGDRSSGATVEPANCTPDKAKDPIEDCWKQFPLERWEQFGLTAGILGKLAEASPPITTVGELNDYTSPKANGYVPKLADIAGVGKAAVQKIEDAGIAFWQWWPSHRDDFAREIGIDGARVETAVPESQATAADWAEPGVNGRPEK